MWLGVIRMILVMGNVSTFQAIGVTDGICSILNKRQDNMWMNTTIMKCCGNHLGGNHERDLCGHNHVMDLATATLLHPRGRRTSCILFYIPRGYL